MKQRLDFDTAASKIFASSYERSAPTEPLSGRSTDATAHPEEPLTLSVSLQVSQHARHHFQEQDFEVQASQP